MSLPEPPGPAGFGGEAEYPVPPFDPEKPHHRKPKLRPVRAFSARSGEQQYMGLADARQISQRVVLTHPAFQLVLPLLDGNRAIEDVVREVGRGLKREMLEQLIAQLDAAALLEGPKFDALERELREQFDAADSLPPSITADFADALVAQKHGGEATDEQKKAEGPALLRAQFDQWIDHALRDAPDPSFERLPRAIVSPHIDYGRGWLNYAHAWGRMRVVDRPARVVILGANHYGKSTGVCGCNKGFESPLGPCAYAGDFAEALVGRLGADNADRLFANRFDHEREHSIELQIAWLQHALGADDAGGFPAVFAALVHDPSVNNGESYDGAGLAILPFIEALRGALADMDGPTLIVCSADLSHVGQMFGDNEPVVGEQADAEGSVRNRAIQHDREMLALFAQGKAEEIVSAMAWMQNPTRWCSIGAMTATLMALDKPEVRIAHYGGAVDQAGTCMVTSCAAAIF